MKCYLILLMLFVTGNLCAQEELPTIKINYNGSAASVSIPASVSDVTCSSGSSSHVVITSNSTASEYRYQVKGSTTNGSLTITSNGYKMTLEMAGIQITNPMGGAMNINCSKRIAVMLADGTNNTLADGIGGAQKACLYFAGHPEFEGGGTLNVIGNTKHAISAKEYLELKENTGTINVTGAVSDGIHCGRGKINNDNNYFEINGGTVNISGVGSDCIDSDDYGCMKIKGGTLNLTVSALGGAGLKCDSILNMKDGKVNITLTGEDAEGIRCNYLAKFKDGDIDITNSGTGSKGIKLKKEISGTVLNGGNAEFSGTDVEITLLGATALDGSRCMGISVDENMSIIDGDIALKRYGNQVKSHNVKGTLAISETGRMILRGNHYTPNTTAQHNMTVYAKARRLGLPVNDYANLHIGAYQGTMCKGNADIVMVKDGYIYAYLPVNGTNSQTLSLRLYDASENRELPSKETFKMADNSTLGTPSNPFSFGFCIKGDVNADGKVSIADLTHLIRILNGGTTEGFDIDGADVDLSNKLSKADVTAWKELKLQK